MSEQNGDGRQVDMNVVLANLTAQLGRLHGELALRDAYITQLEAELAAAKAEPTPT